MIVAFVVTDYEFEGEESEFIGVFLSLDKLSEVVDTLDNEFLRGSDVVYYEAELGENLVGNNSRVVFRSYPQVTDEERATFAQEMIETELRRQEARDNFFKNE
jgi:hypothetical protein